MTFKRGDLVRLKSGGPVMTVASEVGGSVEAVWFVGAEHRSALFNESMLHFAEQVAARFRPAPSELWGDWKAA